ncbi:sensor domain-containing diguanylate cyclase [Silvimonas iriomotensis]|uniref:diguanylate cyclase n=1 Tax=Silvimonas iriomotensis TaxID=449662 RepID=A0ABQ2PB77_9NEIS|nr:sensor domain-containing diguanylate cyclase [Silvimonas iriomotensis]GGP22768.1 GGDEF domain-containing protein [Silvimonas iriomotensis]
MDSKLVRLAESASSARSLEELAQPLLELLQNLTEFESTYITRIDSGMTTQLIEFARNVGKLEIPEQLAVPWSDTLCKRSMESGCTYTDDVPGRWPDSDAARALGIQSYISAPIRTHSGSLIGTLCAASTKQMALPERARTSLHLFSRLIAQHIEREKLLDQLQETNNRLTRAALTDPLTALPNRRAILEELARLLALARREDSTVLVGLVDLDHFREVNETQGHVRGDHLLSDLATHLNRVARDYDVVGRFDGDEFAIIGPGPASKEEAERVAAEVTRLYADAAASIQSASVAFVVADGAMSADEAIRYADKEMSSVKRAKTQVSAK